MSAEVINSTLNSTTETTTGVQHHEKKKPEPVQVDALLLAFLCILDSVGIDHETAAIQAKGIESNVKSQQQLIQDESAVNYVELSKTQVAYKAEGVNINGMVITGINAQSPAFQGDKIRGVHPVTVWESKVVSQTVLENMSSQNEEISAIKGVIEDKMNVLRQSQQIEDTSVNSTVDEAEQSIQEGGSLMQMLVNLTQQISRI